MGMIRVRCSYEEEGRWKVRAAELGVTLSELVRALLDARVVTEPRPKPTITKRVKRRVKSPEVDHSATVVEVPGKSQGPLLPPRPAIVSNGDLCSKCSRLGEVKGCGNCRDIRERRKQAGAGRTDAVVGVLGAGDAGPVAGHEGGSGMAAGDQPDTGGRSSFERPSADVRERLPEVPGPAGQVGSGMDAVEAGQARVDVSEIPF